MGKNSGGDEAKQARQDEEKRQAEIRAGTDRINNIFNGSLKGINAYGADEIYDPNKKYWLADGTLWQPSAIATTSGANANGSVSAALGKIGQSKHAPGKYLSSEYNVEEARKRGMVKTDPNGYEYVSMRSGPEGENTNYYVRGSGPNSAANQTVNSQSEFQKMLADGKLFSGVDTTGGFNDNFFNNRRQAYIDYATPQLEDQYGKAQKELTYALTRSGNLDSSMRAEKTGDLQKMYDLNKQKIADDALSYETQARNSVEDARANLIATLNATGDAQGAANSAIARAQALSQPVAYSPVGQIFTDFTSALGTQAAQERAEAASQGGYTARYNTGLFGNSGRVKVAK